MSEASDEVRRQTFLRTLNLVSAGDRRCAGRGRETECFVKRTAPSGDTKPRCLDCWKMGR